MTEKAIFLPSEKLMYTISLKSDLEFVAMVEDTDTLLFAHL